MQADEIRYKEDMPALGLNWIRLGLDDVLYDPKSKTIYTPNTNASVKVGEAVKNLPDDDGEQRFNENHDDRGRFTFGKSGGSSGKGIDKSAESDIIEVDPTGRNDFKVKGFANKQKLNNHWQNGRTHKEEFVKDGIITKEQY